MKPYVYKITSLKGEYYFGVRWNYKGNPENDLWVNYFTSSTFIHMLIAENNLEYFRTEILKTFEDKKVALDYEYCLIKESIGDKLCLNRSVGKCTIWDNSLKKKVSESMKDFCKNDEVISKRIENSLGDRKSVV